MIGVDSPVLRKLTIATLGVATLSMLALSMLTNATFGYRFGTTPLTSAVFAGANVIADLWKSLGLIVVVSLFRHRQRGIATILSTLWFVALAFGVASSMGVYVQDRTALIGGREGRSAQLRAVEQELAEVETRLVTLATTGNVAQIEADVEALLAKPVTVGDRVRGTIGSLSGRCSKIDVRTIAQCHQVAALKSQLAVAVERKERDGRAKELRSRIASLRDTGAGEAADPVAEMFAWLSRGLLSVRDVGFGFPVAFGLLIEMVSAFGPIGVATYASATRSIGSSVVVASPASLTRPDVAPLLAGRSAGSVIDFMSEQTEPASESVAIGGHQLHEAYVRWSGDKGQTALRVEDFITEFDRLRDLPELRGEIRKFGSRYFGISLAMPQRKRSAGRG